MSPTATTTSSVGRRVIIQGITTICIWIITTQHNVGVVTADNACETRADDTTTPCVPCDRDKWQYMVSDACSDKLFFDKTSTCIEPITDTDGCFNNDPLQVKSMDMKEVVSEDKPDLDPSISSSGFTIPKIPFFRYFLPPDSKTARDYSKFDIGQVKDFYVKEPSTGSTGFDTDFELFEWPGKTTEQHAQFLEEITAKAYGCAASEDPLDASNAAEEACKIEHRFVTVAYVNDNTKFLNYPCNSETGTQILAYGHSQSVDGPTENAELGKIPGSPTQTVWLSYGHKSMHREYVQPLKVRYKILEQMKPDPEDPNARTDCADVTDWRVVMDFSFATERLVLGLKCGILLATDLLKDVFYVHSATLVKPYSRTTAFDSPVNLISSSICCDDHEVCSKQINVVAAYSFDAKRKPGDLKYIYISFDEGDTFEQKFMGPVESLINLIKGMYGAYQRFYWYYEFLEKGVENKDLFKTYKKMKIWETLNAEEKEVFIKVHTTGFGSAGKADTGKDVLRGLMCNEVKAKLDEVGDDGFIDLTPEWVNTVIAERYSSFNVTNQTDCEKIPDCKDEFEKDIIVEEIFKDYPVKVHGTGFDCPTDEATYKWKERVAVYTPKQKPNEPFCLEVVSFVVFHERSVVILLCQVGYCTAAAGGKADCSKIPGTGTNDHYAIFELGVKAMVPIAFATRKSERIFKCSLMKQTFDGPLKDSEIQPTLIPVPGSASLIIANCKGVIYFSPNSGRTIFNAVFYFKEDQAIGTPTADEFHDAKFSRSYDFEHLDVPPAVAIEPKGRTLLLTFNNYYAYGAITYNSEFRLIVGKVFEKPDKTAMGDISKEEVVAIPWFTNSGDIAVSLALLSIIGKEVEYKDFYAGRQALRFIQIPLSFYKDSVPFFSENNNAIKSASSYSLGNCNTYVFSYAPKIAALDLGDEATVMVSVSDTFSDLPLTVFSNEELGLVISVALSNRSLIGEVSEHDWNVTIRAVPHVRPSEEAFIDAFFGTEYTVLSNFDTNVVLVNRPTTRCTVQPSGTVKTEVGCLGKVLVAHEDEYRPQCKNYIDFNYTLKAGMYDPELARYWIETNPNFVRRGEKGELHITYDYTTFGCPIEPYSDDEFYPDLRVLSEENRRNSTLGKHFSGTYVVIEVFGASGYKFLWKNKDAECTRAPQTAKKMIKDWAVRRRIFNITAGRLKSFMNAGEAPGVGNNMFDSRGVDNHLNIWNRVNYMPCADPDDDDDDDDDDDPKPDPDWDEEEDYEIMNNDVQNDDEQPNSLIWESKNRPRVFVFLAVAVDPIKTICNHYTIFGVSLPKAQEVDDILSFICFIVFTLLWIFLVILGYWCRKSYIRTAYIEEARSERLKQAAWTVIYRYEKLLHENEHKELENEISEFSKALYQKDREKAYEQMKVDQQKRSKAPPQDSNKKPKAQPPPPPAANVGGKK